MNEHELLSVAQDLQLAADKLAPAQSYIWRGDMPTTDLDYNEIEIKGNRSALIQLAADCLQAAASPLNVDKEAEKINFPIETWKDFELSPLELRLKCVSRLEKWPTHQELVDTEKTLAKQDYWINLFINLFAALVLSLAGIGFFSIGNWLGLFT
jgi:hypothetical protein